MLIPSIDFTYWYNQNQANALLQNRFISMITRICNIYQINNSHKQAFFCGNEIEIDRLKKLNYNELEEEIINRIKAISSIDLANENEILEIFDLINIWGGLQGGSNFYNIKDGTSTRIQYKKWLPKYIEIIKKAILKNSTTYFDVLNGEIPYLNMSFGSKHISFWSRKNGNNKCLIVIDNKIAGITGIKKAKNADFSIIIQEVHDLEVALQLEPQQIEKGLFSFHSYYFDNENTKFNGDSGNIDYSIAYKIKEKLGINDEIEKKGKTVSRTPYSKNTQINNIEKFFTKTTTDGCIYIKNAYIERHNELKRYIDKRSSLKLNGEIYLKYIGNMNLIKIQ